MTKRAEVANAIRQEILASRWRPGMRLTERALCEFTGASRSSVREALQLLQQEGFVENRPHRGVTVATLDAREAADIYQVRSVLEGLAARNFINLATAGQRTELHASLDMLETAIEQEDVARQLQAIERFYDALLDGCYNAVLRNSLQELHGKISRLRATSILSQGRIRNTLKEMRRIGEAIRENDEEAAWQACVDHMRSTSAVAIRMIDYLNSTQMESTRQEGGA